MNVALALFRYFPHGGMQRDLAATARLLRDRCHEVTVFCHTLDGSPPTDVEVEVLPAPGRSNHSRARAFARALEHRLSVRRPDVVVGFDKMPGLDLYFAAAGVTNAVCTPVHASNPRRADQPQSNLLLTRSCPMSEQRRC